MHKRTIAGRLLVFLLLVSVLSGCSSKDSKAGASTHPVAMAEVGTMPAQVLAESQVVVDAYRFAAANPEILRQIPCYCGCGPMGHQSNYDCFWQADGNFESHALECGLCVDIAQDTRRGLEQGHALSNIRQQIDADYSRFGPATDTPPVAALVK